MYRKHSTEISFALRGSTAAGAQVRPLAAAYDSILTGIEIVYLLTFPLHNLLLLLLLLREECSETRKPH